MKYIMFIFAAVFFISAVSHIFVPFDFNVLFKVFVDSVASVTLFGAGMFIHITNPKKK